MRDTSVGVAAAEDEAACAAGGDLFTVDADVVAKERGGRWCRDRGVDEHEEGEENEVNEPT